MRASTLLLAACVLAALPLCAAFADDLTACRDANADSDAAIAACSRAMSAPKLSAAKIANLYAWRGMFWARKADYDHAIADLSAAIKYSPNYADAYANRGDAYGEKGDFAREIADLDIAIRIDPNHYEYYNSKALALAHLGEVDRALAAVDEAIRLAPNEAALFASKASLLVTKGDLDQAIAAASDALRLNPNSASSLNVRGAAYREKGDFDRGIADFDAAIRIDPKYPNAYSNRGVLWRSKGQLDQALANFDEAIRLNPAYADAYANRGFVFEAKGDLERARADFTTALSFPPQLALTRRYQDAARVRLALLTTSDQPAAPPAPTHTGAKERHIALVIGNSAYQNATALPNPANDARAVAAALRGMGFEVSEAVDLDRAGMNRSISAFLLDAAKSQLALFFYAGHGLQIEGANYLLPVDTKVANASELAAGMTGLDKILTGLDDQIRTNIIILDACRDNPFAAHAVAQTAASRSVAASPGLAAPAQPGTGAALGAGTLIAFATAPGQLALDGTGADSPFSTALLRHISAPGLEIQQMLTRVRADVVAATGSKQVPWSNSSLLGEVYLAGNKP